MSILAEEFNEDLFEINTVKEYEFQEASEAFKRVILGLYSDKLPQNCESLSQKFKILYHETSAINGIKKTFDVDFSINSEDITVFTNEGLKYFKVKEIVFTKNKIVFIPFDLQ